MKGSVENPATSHMRKRYALCRENKIATKKTIGSKLKISYF